MAKKKVKEAEDIGEIVRSSKANNMRGPFLLDIEDPDEMAKKAYISDAIREVMQYWMRPVVKNEEEAMSRINEYFTNCLNSGSRPTVEGLAVCLGTTRKTLFDWESGVTRGPISRDIIKNVKESIGMFDAKLVSEGKLNPVTYIFRSKNYYGMRDQQEHILTPNTSQTMSQAELLAQAETLPDEG